MKVFDQLLSLYFPQLQSDKPCCLLCTLPTGSTEPESVTAPVDNIDYSNNNHPEELKKVMDALIKDGHVMLCTVPGARRDNILHELCRNYHEQGFTILDFVDFKPGRGEGLPVRRYLFILNNALGLVRLDSAQYKRFNDNGMYSISHNATDHIVFLQTPNIVSEFQQCNRLASPHVANTVQIVKTKQDCLLSDYVDLLLGMLRDRSHGRVMGALLALTIEGHSCLSKEKGETEDLLVGLGFKRFTHTVLQEYASLFEGFLLAEEGKRFISREVYMAAVISIATVYSKQLMLRVCDVQFLVQNVYTEHGTAAENHTAESHSTVTPFVLKDQDLVLLLMKRMCEAMVTNRLPEISQHPCLQSQLFLQEFEAFCKNTVQLDAVMSASDPDHGLPLLYWSMWSMSHELIEWCLRMMMSQHTDCTVSEDHLLRTALVAALVTNLTDTDMSRLVTYLSDNIVTLTEGTGTVTVSLPLPRGEVRYTDTLYDLCNTMARNLSRGSLFYQGTPIPRHLLTVEFTEDVIEMTLQGHLLKVLLRLLTHRQVDEKDREGNTLLHLAADTGQLEVVQMLVNSEASVMAKNKAGLTPPQLAARRRKQHQDSTRPSWTHFQTACTAGDMDAVNPFPARVYEVFFIPVCRDEF